MAAGRRVGKERKVSPFLLSLSSPAPRSILLPFWFFTSVYVPLLLLELFLVSPFFFCQQKKNITCSFFHQKQKSDFFPSLFPLFASPHFLARLHRVQLPTRWTLSAAPQRARCAVKLQEERWAKARSGDASMMKTMEMATAAKAAATATATATTSPCSPRGGPGSASPTAAPAFSRTSPRWASSSAR